MPAWYCAYCSREFKGYNISKMKVPVCDECTRRGRSPMRHVYWRGKHDALKEENDRLRRELERFELKDRAKTRDINILTKENRELREKIEGKPGTLQGKFIDGRLKYEDGNLTLEKDNPERGEGECPECKGTGHRTFWNGTIPCSNCNPASAEGGGG